MSEAIGSLQGVGATLGLDGSATLRALQESLMESLSPTAPVSGTVDADTSAVAAGTQPGDPVPDAAPGNAALAARSSPARRTAGDTGIDPGASGELRSDLAAPLGAQNLALPPETAAVPLVATLVGNLHGGAATGLLAQGWRAEDEPRPHRRAGRDEGDAGDAPSSASDDTAERDAAPAPPLPLDEDALQAALRQLESQAEADPPWCAPLLSSLRAQARRPDASVLLSLALAQWRIGRTVLIAVPRQGREATAGWLHALRVVPGATGPRMSAQRFDAMMNWHRRPTELAWWGVRATKQQSLHIGRQLLAQADLPEPRGSRPVAGSVAPRVPSLGLRLGSPGADAQPHVPSVLQLQVDAVARLWSTVELQWHVVLLACSHPLVEGSPA